MSEISEIKALLAKMVKLLERIAPPPPPPEAAPPPAPPTPPAPPAITRVREYYRIVARKRMDVKTTATEPYEIPYTADPKIILLIAWGDDIQVDFDKPVSEDSPPIADGGSLALAVEGVSKIYAQSMTTDLTAPNGLYILVLG